ncbi:MAG: hypothetical protein WD077_13610 [Bacteroidia bacterium]
MILLLPALLRAQITPVDAYTAGLAGSSLGSEDHWAALQNQAMLSEAEGFSAGLSTFRLYGLAELTGGAMAAAIPVKEVAVIGANATFFGNQYFTQYRVGLTGARKFGKVRAGLQINWMTSNWQGYGSESTIYAEAGLAYQVEERLIIAAHISNPALYGTTPEEVPMVPMKFNGEGRYEFSETMRLMAGIEKSMGYPARGRVAFSYKPAQKLELYAGILTSPANSSFGLNYALNKLRLDLSFSLHQQLGLTPYLTLNYFDNIEN